MGCFVKNVVENKPSSVRSEYERLIIRIIKAMYEPSEN